MISAYAVGRSDSVTARPLNAVDVHLAGRACRGYAATIVGIAVTKLTRKTSTSMPVRLVISNLRKRRTICRVRNPYPRPSQFCGQPHLPRFRQILRELYPEPNA